MSSTLDDRWLWLGFGAFVFCAYKGIQYAFDDITELTVLEPLEDSDENSSDNRPEDSIDFDTLKTLADSPNYNISQSAVSIIIERVLKDCNFDNGGGWLGQDLSSPDPEIRRQARQAQEFVQDHLRSIGQWPRNVWNRPESGHFGLNSDDGRSTPASLPELIDARNEVGELVQVGSPRLGGWRTVQHEGPDAGERERVVGVSSRAMHRHAVVINPSPDDVEDDDIIRF